MELVEIVLLSEMLNNIKTYFSKGDFLRETVFDWLIVRVISVVNWWENVIETFWL